jgi:hypothetical protein
VNREEANKILDQVRDGYPCSKTRTDEALHFTGDTRPYARVRSKGLDEEAAPEDWRARVRSRAIMVGRSKR